MTTTTTRQPVQKQQNVVAAVKKRGAGGTDALFKITSNRLFVVSRTWEDSDESYDDAISSLAAKRVVVAKRSPFSTTYVRAAQVVVAGIGRRLARYGCKLMSFFLANYIFEPIAIFP